MVGIRSGAVAAAALFLTACGGGPSGPLEAQTGTTAWARAAGNSGNTVGTGVATFVDGSQITVGAFDGAAAFGVGTPAATTLVPGTGVGVYLARYDKKGLLTWVRRAVGVGTVQAMGVVTHGDGTFSVTGFYDGSATFGEGEPNETLLATTGFEDVFVAHYAGDGRLLWARSAEGTFGYEEATRIAARPDGSIAITGQYTIAMTFGVGEPNETALPPASGGAAGFVACFAADGSLAWATSFSGTTVAGGWGVGACSDGGLAVCGYYAGDAVFGAGELAETHFTAVGTSLDVFTARYDANGNLVWARTAGDAGDDAAYGVAVAPGDLVRVVGVFGGTATFGSESLAPEALVGFGDSSDDFVAGYDDLGTFQWAKAFGSTGYDFATAIATFADGTFAVTGTLAGDATFGAGEPSETHVSTAGVDDHEIFVARFQPDGRLDWLAATAGILGSDNEGTAIAANSDGSCVVAGYFVDALTFTTGLTLIGHTNASLLGVGDHDAYLARYNPNGGFH